MPYKDAMANHVSEFMRVHGSILSFTQQGLEKYNDMMTKEYFRATCHRKDEALIQIMSAILKPGPLPISCPSTYQSARSCMSLIKGHCYRPQTQLCLVEQFLKLLVLSNILAS